MKLAEMIIYPNKYVIINMIHKDEKIKIFEGFVMNIPPSLLEENKNETKTIGNN